MRLLLGILIIFLLGCNNNSNIDTTQTLETLNKSQIIQTALDYKGLQPYWFPNYPGREILYITGSDIPSDLDVVWNNQPTQILTSDIDNNTNLLLVKEISVIEDSAHLIILYQPLNAYADLFFKKKDDQWIIDSSFVCQL